MNHHNTKTRDMYVVYWNPEDYPNKFVVRRFKINPLTAQGTPDIVPTVVDHLKDARMTIPKGLRNIGQMPGDKDKRIFETWM